MQLDTLGSRLLVLASIFSINGSKRQPPCQSLKAETKFEKYTFCCTVISPFMYSVPSERCQASAAARTVQLAVLLCFAAKGFCDKYLGWCNMAVADMDCVLFWTL